MDDVRYGVYLRPDPPTSWAIQQLIAAVHGQFGLGFARAFPPHMTLVGNLALRVDEPELIAALDPVFAATEPFPVHVRGPIAGAGVHYDTDQNGAGTGRNAPLVSVAGRAHAAVLPLSRPVSDHLVTPVEAHRFKGHMGLAGPDLAGPDQRDDVLEFVTALPLTLPDSFVARRFDLVRFTAPWDRPWWTELTWEHRWSWNVT